MTLASLAWRNIWRHGRRSLITAASIGSGLAAILFGQSLLKTIQYQLVEKATGVFTGHLRVLARGTSDFKLPDRYIEDPAPVERSLQEDGDLAAFEKRLLITGLVSSKKDSAGVLICGVEPEKDRRVISISNYRVAGEYLGKDPKGLFVGDKLAEALGLSLGAEAVLMFSALDGSMAAELFHVEGLFHSGSQTFDGSIIYAPLAAIQGMLEAGRKVNDFVLRLKDPERVEDARAALARTLRGRPVVALTWRDVDHELVGIQRYQDALLGVILVVIFLIVSLGICNTILMSILERVREFGVLMALGAGRGWIIRLVLLESCLLGLLGAAFGMALGTGLILYFRRAGLALPVSDAVSFFMPFDPVLYLRFSWPAHALALLCVLLVSVLGAVPALRRIFRLKPSECLRQA